MTREEVKIYIAKNLEFMKNEIDTDIVDELIDKIFNDFASQTCKNCKWFEENDKNKRFWDTELLGYCLKKELWNGLYKRITIDDFGCNRFERKEK